VEVEDESLVSALVVDLDGLLVFATVVVVIVVFAIVVLSAAVVAVPGSVC